MVWESPNHIESHCRLRVSGQHKDPGKANWDDFRMDLQRYEIIKDHHRGSQKSSSEWLSENRDHQEKEIIIENLKDYLKDYLTYYQTDYHTDYHKDYHVKSIHRWKIYLQITPVSEKHQALQLVVASSGLMCFGVIIAMAGKSTNIRRTKWRFSSWEKSTIYIYNYIYIYRHIYKQQYDIGIWSKNVERIRNSCSF